MGEIIPPLSFCKYIFDIKQTQKIDMSLNKKTLLNIFKSSFKLYKSRGVFCLISYFRQKMVSVVRVQIWDDAACISFITYTLRKSTKLTSPKLGINK